MRRGAILALSACLLLIPAGGSATTPKKVVCHKYLVRKKILPNGGFILTSAIVCHKKAVRKK